MGHVMRDIVAGLLAFVCIFAASTVQADGKYKVGAILPLSGDAASWGKACQNGIKLAYDSLDAATRNKIDIVFEDDALQPNKAVAALQKLSSVEHVGAAISYGSGASMALAPIVEEKNIPTVAIASDVRIVKDKKYVFNFWVTPEMEADVLINEVRQKKYKRLVRINAIWDGVVAVNKAFDERQNGVTKIVMEQEYTQDVRDFKSFIAKLRGLNNVDAVYCMLMPGQVGVFMKQLRQQGVKLPVINIETFEDPNDVKASEGAMIGTHYVQADDPSSAFLDKFEKEFPGSATNSAANCHDTVILIGGAVREGIPLEKYLEHVKDFSGAMGIYSSTGDHRFSLPAALKVITERGFEKVSE